MTHILFLLAACDFSASTTVKVDDTGTSAVEDTASVDTATGAEDTGEPPHPSDVDDDGDGFSENDGDCDDDNIDVHPDVKEDTCDGVDNDCDGAIDQDAANDDEYEPNDDKDYDLGSIDGTVSVQGLLHNDDDVDQFSFTIPDSWWSTDDVSVILSGIPDGATYRLTLENARSGEQIFQDFHDELVETTIGDDWWADDSGKFRAIVDAISGADCSSSYTLIIE